MCAPKSSTRQEQCVGVANQLPARSQTSGMTSPQQSLAFSGRTSREDGRGGCPPQPARVTDVAHFFYSRAIKSGEKLLKGFH